MKMGIQTFLMILDSRFRGNDNRAKRVAILPFFRVQYYAMFICKPSKNIGDRAGLPRNNQIRSDIVQWLDHEPALLPVRMGDHYVLFLDLQAVCINNVTSSE